MASNFNTDCDDFEPFQEVWGERVAEDNNNILNFLSDESPVQSPPMTDHPRANIQASQKERELMRPEFQEDCQQDASYDSQNGNIDNFLASPYQPRSPGLLNENQEDFAYQQMGVDVIQGYENREDVYIPPIRVEHLHNKRENYSQADNQRKQRRIKDPLEPKYLSDSDYSIINSPEPLPPSPKRQRVVIESDEEYNRKQGTKAAKNVKFQEPQHSKSSFERESEVGKIQNEKRASNLKNNLSSVTSSKYENLESIKTSSDETSSSSEKSSEESDDNYSPPEEENRKKAAKKRNIKRHTRYTGSSTSTNRRSVTSSSTSNSLVVPRGSASSNDTFKVRISPSDYIFDPDAARSTLSIRDGNDKRVFHFFEQIRNSDIFFCPECLHCGLATRAKKSGNAVFVETNHHLNCLPKKWN